MTAGFFVHCYGFLSDVPRSLSHSVLQVIPSEAKQYHHSDIARAQQATPAVDPDVISYMEKTNT
jgi:hypothetical protein